MTREIGEVNTRLLKGDASMARLCASRMTSSRDWITRSYSGLSSTMAQPHQRTCVGETPVQNCCLKPSLTFDRRSAVDSAPMHSPIGGVRVSMWVQGSAPSDGAAGSGG